MFTIFISHSVFTFTQYTMKIVYCTRRPSYYAFFVSTKQSKSSLFTLLWFFYRVRRLVRIDAPREQQNLCFRLWSAPARYHNACIIISQPTILLLQPSPRRISNRYWIYYKWLIDVVYCFKLDKSLFALIDVSFIRQIVDNAPRAFLLLIRTSLGSF